MTSKITTLCVCVFMIFTGANRAYGVPDTLRVPDTHLTVDLAISAANIGDVILLTRDEPVSQYLSFTLDKDVLVTGFIGQRPRVNGTTTLRKGEVRGLKFQGDGGGLTQVLATGYAASDDVLITDTVIRGKSGGITSYAIGSMTG